MNIDYGDSCGDDPRTIRIKRGTQVRLRNICSKQNDCQIQNSYSKLAE